jgi:hypothetical protein
MNRKQRRDLSRKMKGRKPAMTDWTCPGCSAHYDIIFVQSSAEPYLFCHKGCEEFFDLTGENATAKVYPNGKPF